MRPVTGHGAARQPGQDPVRIQVIIVASDLPGRDCGPSGDFPGFEATAAPIADGIDIKGPYIQGRPGARFIYLSWGTVDHDGTFTMFRRPSCGSTPSPPPPLTLSGDTDRSSRT